MVMKINTKVKKKVNTKMKKNVKILVKPVTGAVEAVMHLNNSIGYQCVDFGLRNSWTVFRQTLHSKFS